MNGKGNSHARGASVGNGNSLGNGNSFANGPTGLMKLLGAAYADAKALTTTIYDLGA